MFLSHTYNYTANADNFSKIPGSPVAYWVSNDFIRMFENKTISSIAFSDGQILTGNNEKYLRFIWEVNRNSIEDRSKWVLHAKGGTQRRWYGNIDTVVSWTQNSINHYKNDKISRFPKEHILFRKGITWSLVSSSDMFSMRILTEDTTFNKAAATILFYDNTFIPYVLGFLNTSVTRIILTSFNPTMNTNIKDILALPIKIISNQSTVDKINAIVEENISLSKADWDSFETSWDFEEHPIVREAKDLWDATAVGATMMHYYGSCPEVSCPLELCFMLWQGECNERFNKLKANEEELNRIFIDIYGLQDELTPEVDDKDVTVRKADLTREIKSLISYAVGCMFGRYSLDVDGLAYAGGEWDSTKYKTFEADKDAIIPICDDEYFDDDIVARFVEFIKVVYGEDTLEENLGFIASALGGKGTPRQVIRNYFIKDFYKDHCNIYQKRPIYWLFDSGKNNGFKCLIYLHRYKHDTIARIRTDYVHEQQSKYRTATDDLENRKEKASASDKVRLSKQLSALRDQAEELRQYEEKIHHLADQMISIDLDDGVKKNYELFSDVLAKIK